MQCNLPFSHRSLSSVPYLLIFHKDHSPQLSLDNATPYSKVSTGGREVSSCLRQPLSLVQKRGQHPLTPAYLFSIGAWVQQVHRGVGSLWDPWLSLFCKPLGGSSCQFLAATRVSGLPGQTLLSKGDKEKNLFLCSCLPHLSKVSIVLDLDQVTVWFIRRRESSVLWTVWNRCNY